MRTAKCLYVVRRVVLVSCFCIASLFGKTQTQALKQLQLDIEKLAQLKIMLNNMYSGYTTLAAGYNNIKSQAVESFTLHKNYIDALSAISPAVRNAPAIGAILSLQAQIVSEYKTAYQKVQVTGVFTPKEIKQLTDACSKIVAESSLDLDALQLVTTAGKLQMTEPERLNIIESLRSDLEKQLSDLRNFTSATARTALVRQRMQKENKQLRSIYGIVK